jgi:hypothetical protein
MAYFEKSISSERIEALSCFLLDRYEFRFNKRKGIIEYADSVIASKKFRPINLASIKTECRRNDIDFRGTELNDLLNDTDYFISNHFDSIKDFFGAIQGSPADGYIDKLFNHIVIDADDNVTYRLIEAFKTWLANVYQSTYDPEYVNRQQLIFYSPNGADVTTLIRKIFNVPELKENYSEEIVTETTDGLLSLSDNLVINYDQITKIRGNDLKTLNRIQSKLGSYRREFNTTKKKIRDRIASFTGTAYEPDFLNTSDPEKYLVIPISKVCWSDELEDLLTDTKSIWSYPVYLARSKEYNLIFTDSIKSVNRQHVKTTLEIDLFTKHFKAATIQDLRNEKPNVNFYQTVDIVSTLKRLYPDQNFNKIQLGRSIAKLENYQNKRFKKVNRQGYFLEHINE